MISSLSWAAKVSLPHVALVIFLLIYILAGTGVLLFFETNAERAEYEQKLASLRQAYDDLTNQTFALCQAGTSHADYEALVYSSLLNISTIHGRYYAPVEAENINRRGGHEFNGRWTFPATLIYALGVLTTSGYSYLQLNTNFAKIFVMIYGMFGFPLMFITCANIGKFMSETIVWFYRQSRPIRRRAAAPFTEPLLDHDAEDNDSGTYDVELGAWTIFVSTGTVCCFGAFLFMALHGWSFPEALFYSVNAITNVSLGDSPATTLFSVAITFAYVICGLAVVTMSLDLAQNRLRELFTKLHNVGRQLRTRLMTMHIDDDVRMVLKMMSVIRQRHPSQGPITAADLLSFIEKEETVAEAKRLLAFVPQGEHFDFADDFAMMDDEDDADK